jgi:hypothetical protein
VHASTYWLFFVGESSLKSIFSRQQPNVHTQPAITRIIALATMARVDSSTASGSFISKAV